MLDFLGLVLQDRRALQDLHGVPQLYVRTRERTSVLLAWPYHRALSRSGETAGAADLPAFGGIWAARSITSRGGAALGAVAEQRG